MTATITTIWFAIMTFRMYALYASPASLQRLHSCLLTGAFKVLFTLFHCYPLRVNHVTAGLGHAAGALLDPRGLAGALAHGLGFRV